MPDLLYRITSALSFYRRARTIYQLHGPLAYELAAATVEDDRSYYAFDEIASLRRQLQEDEEPITFGQWGAVQHEQKEAPFGKWMKKAALRPVWGRLLFRIALHRRPRRILELGAGAGISALYLSAACPECRLDTVEGNPQLAEKARLLFQRQQRRQVRVHRGAFRKVLSSPELANSYDLIYIDGEHTGTGMQLLFEALQPLAHAETLVIFDDIRWSAETEKAWESIRRNESVRLSLDLFQFGLLLFSPRIREKQHLPLVHHRWKPWSALRGW